MIQKANLLPLRKKKNIQMGLKLDQTQLHLLQSYYEDE